MESFGTWKQKVDYDRDEQNKYRNCDFNPGTHVDRAVKCMMLIILTYACALYSKSRASVGFNGDQSMRAHLSISTALGHRFSYQRTNYDRLSYYSN